MTTKTLTAKQVQEKLDHAFDTCSLRDGVYTVRRSFYYPNGVQWDYAEMVLKAFPNANIIDCARIDKPFRGGASIAQSSHFLVRFTLATPEPLPHDVGAEARGAVNFK